MVRTKNTGKYAESCSSCGKTSINNCIGWFQCDKCNKWFHALCVNVNKEDFNIFKDKEFWFCPSCVNSSNMSSTNSSVDAQQIAEKVMLDCFSGTEFLTKLANLIKSQVESLIPRIIDDIKTHVDSKYESKFKVLEDTITKLEVQSAEFETKSSYLEEKLKEIEKEREGSRRFMIQYERRYYKKNILLKGIPSNIDFANTGNILGLARAINFNDLTAFDIDYFSRFKIEADSTLTLLVSFTSQVVKEEFMRRYLAFIKRYKKFSLKYLDDSFPDEIIYINNHNDANTHQLFGRARYLKREGLLQKVTLSYGRITILTLNKERRVIKDIDDLQEFEQKLISPDSPSHQKATG